MQSKIEIRKIIPGLAVSAALVLALAAGGGGAAWGQARSTDDTTRLADQIVGCAGLDDEQERLQCYDALAQPLLGLDESTEDSPTALHGFTGRDDWDSDPIEVDTPWRLVWQNQGSLLTVELRTAQNEMIDVIGNQIGRGGGRSAVIEPGSYRLAVRGLGGWRVQVVGETGN
ncbi:MAG: hypothetical protein ACFCUW_09170 [Kiloniellaceae bacterium]